MYESFYGLKETPFTIIPNPAVIFESAKHSQALAYLRYAIVGDIGFVLLTGNIGTGKTTLLRRFMDEIEQEIDVAVVFNTNVDSLGLLQLILGDFGIEDVPKSKTECLSRLNEYLIANFAKKKRSLLVIDEAQNLSREALEEVRLLSNLYTQNHALLQIILCGQPELQQIIADPSLAQLAQRIAIKYHLAPLNKEETREYIQYRLEKAGAANQDLFTPEALDLIYARTGGIPRAINILCNAALVYGYADELPQINDAVIKQVVADNNEAMGKPDTPAAGKSGKKNAPPAKTPAADFALQSLQAEVRSLAGRVQWLESNRNQSDGDNARLLLVLETLVNKERERNETLQRRCLQLEQEIKNLQNTVPDQAGQTPRQQKPQKEKSLLSKIFGGD